VKGGANNVQTVNLSARDATVTERINKEAIQTLERMSDTATRLQNLADRLVGQTPEYPRPQKDYCDHYVSGSMGEILEAVRRMDTIVDAIQENLYRVEQL